MCSLELASLWPEIVVLDHPSLYLVVEKGLCLKASGGLHTFTVGIKREARMGLLATEEQAQVSIALEGKQRVNKRRDDPGSPVIARLELRRTIRMAQAYAQRMSPQSMMLALMSCLACLYVAGRWVYGSQWALALSPIVPASNVLRCQVQAELSVAGRDETIARIASFALPAVLVVLCYLLGSNHV